MNISNEIPLKFRSNFVSNIDWQSYFFIYFLFLDRIVPICLPESGAILTKSFVGQNPFFGNFYCLICLHVVICLCLSVQWCISFWNGTSHLIPISTWRIIEFSFLRIVLLQLDGVVSKKAIPENQLFYNKFNCQLFQMPNVNKSMWISADSRKRFNTVILLYVLDMPPVAKTHAKVILAALWCFRSSWMENSHTSKSESIHMAMAALVQMYQASIQVSAHICHGLKKNCCSK